MVDLILKCTSEWWWLRLSELCGGLEEMSGRGEAGCQRHRNGGDDDEEGDGRVPERGEH